MSIRVGLRSLFDFIKSHLFELNLFNTGTPDEETIRNERRSTRLYLILLIISVVILALYYSIISYTQTIVIQSPTFIQYSGLVQERSLNCPCSTISIKYDKFVQIEPYYHELCQSDFVSDEWIKNLLVLYEQSSNKSISSDFRQTGVFQFQTIRSLCQLAKDTIKDGLQSFLYTDLIQSQLISPELFKVQIGSAITDFINVTPKTFLRTMHFVQDTTAQSLFFVGASMTSVQPIRQYRTFYDGGIVPYPGRKYTFTDSSTCVCSASTATSCMGLAIFKNNTVPGFQTGCYMLSALMNSTLEAFYNQTFVDMLSNSSNEFQILNSSNPNWKIEILLSQMFVKFWANTTTYENYFESCAPDSCQYTINQHYNVWGVIVLLIGLFGGLSSILKILTPILIVNIWPVILRVIFRRQTREAQLPAVENNPGNCYRMMNQSFGYKLIAELLSHLEKNRKFHSDCTSVMQFNPLITYIPDSLRLL